MKNLLAVLQDVFAVLVILGVLLQTPKATGLGGTIGGGGDMSGGYRRRRGFEAGLLKFSAIFIGIFVIISAWLTYIGG